MPTVNDALLDATVAVHHAQKLAKTLEGLNRYEAASEVQTFVEQLDTIRAALVHEAVYG